MTLRNSFTLVSLLALGAALPALAQVPADQPAAGPQAAAPRAADVIIVTANKREESLEDVAVAVTAVTSAQREKLGIYTTQDLANLTPGLSYTGGNERAFLRGVGRQTNNFGAEPGVANYTDGVYESFASISGRDPIFIDRIEVLRGPQGTLYGRNSIGGLINTVSKRPTDDFEAEFRLGAGNYGDKKVAGSISGPIPGTDGAIKGRLVGAYETRDKGVYYNYGTNDTEGYNLDDYTIEGQLAGDITDKFSWWVKYTTGRYHKAGPPGGRTGSDQSSPYDTTAFSLSGSGVNPTWAYGNNPGLIGFTQAGSQTTNPALTDLTKLNSNYATVANLNAYDDAALELVYHTGPFDIKYTGGYVYYDYDLTSDADGVPLQSITYTRNPSNPIGAFYPVAGGPVTQTIFPDATQDYRENRAFFSNELTFTSTYDSPLQWLGGLYAYQENFKQPISQFLPNEPLATAVFDTTGFRANPGGRTYYTNNIGLNNAYGAYGQLDWQFTSTLKATVGLRYSYDEKHITEQDNIVCYLVCAAAFAAVPVPGGVAMGDITGSIFTGVARDAAGNPIVQPGVIGGTAANNFSGVTHNAATGISTRVLGDNWDALTDTAGLEWTPMSGTLAFIKYSSGYKAGGFNATNMAPRPETKPERMDAFEAGLKQQFRDWHLTSNIDAFYYIYRDVQTPLTVKPPPPAPSYTAFVNIPDVHTWGIELENNWQPIENLDINFTYAYLNTSIEDGGGTYSNALLPSTAPGQSIDGNELPQAPQNKVAINVNYTWELPENATLIPSISWYWRDKFTTSVFNDPLTYSPDYDQTDIRLTWNSGDGHFTWIAFARNAWDQQGYEAVSASRRTSSDAAILPSAAADPTINQVYQTFTLTPPRTYGIEFQFHFK